MYIAHLGVGHDDGPPGRGSGRYGWGTGKNPNQHQFTFLSEVERLKKSGLKDGEIAKILLGDKATSTTLRAEVSIQKSEQRKINYQRAVKMLDECNGNKSEAARRLGLKNESSLRSLLDTVSAERADRYQNTADMLKKVIDDSKTGIIDISKGTEHYLGLEGVNRHTFDVAVEILRKEGYVKSWADIRQVGTQNDTTIKVLAKPGTTHGEIQKRKMEIEPITEFTPDKGKTWLTTEKPVSIDSSRVYIRYKEDGGIERDGVIELRPGVEDISLGKSNYAQVRVAVDDKYYMKGMAIYGDVPKGYDIVYNTNKAKGTPKEKVYKELKKVMKDGVETDQVDWENPFGAVIKTSKDRNGVITAGGQRKYIDKDGKEKLSPINKIQDEGDWDSWSKTLSSQFLSKQPIKLINQQIDLSVANRKMELETIRKVSNTVMRKKLLEDYAASCDSNAAKLHVSGFKNQSFQVILPVPGMKTTEIYAPNFKDGDTVALVRFPHGGIFEIPVLKVNNKNPEATKIFGKDLKDAVGINSKVAEQLSGADFDGDTVTVIPMRSNRLNIKSMNPLEGLKDFDPKIYKLPDSAPNISNKTKQNEMGRVSNLITDMTVGGATFDDIEKAVKHSMVVIDSEKHHLDYKQSEKDNNIQALKREYQGVNEKTGQTKGASTILSKASSEVHIPRRKEVTDTKKMTPEELKRWNNGDKVYRDTGETKKVLITDPSKMTADELKAHKAGKKVYRQSTELKTETVKRMDVVDDAVSLVRDKGNEKEMAYASYANELKNLAREARKESRSIKPQPVSAEAKKTYAKEVERLNSALKLAQMNSPKERTAQRIANARAEEKIKANPDLDYEHKQKIRSMAITEARAEVGAKKEQIVISDRELEAIQANAISANKLSEILLNTDQDSFRKRVTPKDSKTTGLTPSEVALAKAMANSGMYTRQEIAERLGISTSTLSKLLK